MPATDLGTRIKRARERKRWTQRQLADALGVGIKSVDNWENNRTRPRNSLGALEAALEVDLSEEPAATPGPLDDLLPLQGDEDSKRWEKQVLEAPLPDSIKRRFIEDWRAHSEARERRQHRRQNGAASATGAA